MICVASSEDSDQPGHPSSLIRVFAVRFIGSKGPKLPSCRQPKLWSDWVESYLCWAHRSFCWFRRAATHFVIWAPSSEFVSSSIPSWQILTAHAQQFRRARDLVFCLKVPLDSMLVWASSGGSGETARMRRLAWTFAARIGDKYQIRLTRSIWCVSDDQWYQTGYFHFSTWCVR